MDWVMRVVAGVVAILVGAAVGLRPYQTALKVDGGTGHDFIAGGGTGDRLNADGSRDRTILTGWDPTITTGAGFSFDEMVSNFGKIRLFGEGDRSVDPAKPVITGAEIGAIFGNSISRFIVGDNVFAQIGTGAVLSAVLSKVGGTFDAYFGTGNGNPVSFDAALNAIVDAPSLGLAIATNIRTAGIGALSAFLTAEIAESLDINSDGAACPGPRHTSAGQRSGGGALFNFAANDNPPIRAARAA